MKQKQEQIQEPKKHERPRKIIYINGVAIGWRFKLSGEIK